MKVNKENLAHAWYMKNCRGKDYITDDVFDAWRYADAMQAEADKRVVKGVPDVIVESGLENLSHDDLIKLRVTVQEIINSNCNHEWDHISAYGGDGDYFVCPCGATKEGK